MNIPIAKNTIVYSRDGNRARFIAQVDDNYFVEPEVEYQSSFDGEMYSDWGSTTSWREIFLVPPREVIDASIAKLNKEYETLRGKINELHGEIMGKESLIAAQKKKFAQHDQLKRLEDFIDGKITHAVITEIHYSSWNTIKIKEIGAAIKEDDENRYNGSTKLVTLFGKSNGNLQWELNKYSCGSGSSQEIIPCKSHEEAVEEAQKVLQKAFELQKEKKIMGTDFLESARKIGLKLSEEMEAFIAEHKKQEYQNKLNYLKNSIKEDQKKLAALEAGSALNILVPPQKEYHEV